MTKEQKELIIDCLVAGKQPYKSEFYKGKFDEAIAIAREIEPEPEKLEFIICECGNPDSRINQN